MRSILDYLWRHIDQNKWIRLDLSADYGIGANLVRVCGNTYGPGSPIGDGPVAEAWTMTCRIPLASKSGPYTSIGLSRMPPFHQCRSFNQSVAVAGKA